MVQESADYVVRNSDAELPDFERTMSEFLHHTKDDNLKEKREYVKRNKTAPMAAWLTICMTKPTFEYTTIAEMAQR
jgi:hypothetical protein